MFQSIQLYPKISRTIQTGHKASKCPNVPKNFNNFQNRPKKLKTSQNMTKILEYFTKCQHQTKFKNFRKYLEMSEKVSKCLKMFKNLFGKFQVSKNVKY